MSKALDIARDFAEIPFEDHEARILALAYLQLRDDCDTAKALRDRLERTLPKVDPGGFLSNDLGVVWVDDGSGYARRLVPIGGGGAK